MCCSSTPPRYALICQVDNAFSGLQDVSWRAVFRAVIANAVSSLCVCSLGLKIPADETFDAKSRAVTADEAANRPELVRSVRPLARLTPPSVAGTTSEPKPELVKHSRHFLQGGLHACIYSLYFYSMQATLKAEMNVAV